MGAIDKIEKYGGCIIADSVGLGKTFTALDIIKYSALRNDRVLSLADVFNAETKQGQRMEKYFAPLSKSIEDLIDKKQEVGVASRFSKVGTAMPQRFDDGMADFELVDFVVLK